MLVAFTRVSRAGGFRFTTLSSQAVGAVQSALSVGGCCRGLFVFETCSLVFAKAGSAATLSHEEKNN
jgi:hypothetical protein